jgi:hypothetical protein
VLGEATSGRRELFITQTFTRVPPRLDTATAQELARARIRAARTLGFDPRLQAIAQQIADELARGATRDAAYAAVRKPLDQLAPSYKRVASVTTALAELETLDGAALLGDARADDIGVGIAQGPHPDIGDRAIWLVAVLAEKR